MTTKRQHALGATQQSFNPIAWLWYDYFEFKPVRIKEEWQLLALFAVLVVALVALVGPMINTLIQQSPMHSHIGQAGWVVLLAAALGIYANIKGYAQFKHVAIGFIGTVICSLPLLTLCGVYSGNIGYIMAALPVERGATTTAVTSLYTIMLLVSLIPLGNPVARGMRLVLKMLNPLEPVEAPVVVVESDMSAEEQKLQSILDKLTINATVKGSTQSHRRVTFDIKTPTGTSIKKLAGSIEDIGVHLNGDKLVLQTTTPGQPGISRLSMPKKGTIKPLMLRDTFDTEEWQAQHPLALPIGMNEQGNGEFPRLDKMPHCLIAGTTGSGKSCTVNSLILGLLNKNGAKDLQMILIDPKMVEFAVFEESNNLAMPVISDMDKAFDAIQAAANEMDYRYQLMSTQKVRSLDAYNKKVGNQNIANPIYEATVCSDDETQIITPISETLIALPALAIFVEEFADLMATNKEVETVAARIAQKGRAAGVHLILVTQRPDKDVVTGLIKANISARICLQVTSGTNSDIVLDRRGGEKLLGNGDALYSANSGTDVVGIQGYLVDDEETEPMVQRFNRKHA